MPPNTDQWPIVAVIRARYSQIMEESSSKLPGIYREEDQSAVSQADAVRAWAVVAFDELIRTAHKYDAVVTYKELALLVQDVSGIRTRVLITNWIGKLLEEVAILAREREEPPLTSLCVHHDGTIGDGYARAPKSVVDQPGEDIEFYAAEHRLLCYQKYAEDLPSDGGNPNLTPAERARRSRRSAISPTSITCASCFVSLPATNVCDECGWSPSSA